MDYSWIGTLLGGAFTAAGTITNSIVNGKTQHAQIEADADIQQVSKNTK